MASLDYVSIPSSATRLDSAASTSDIRPAKRIPTTLPSPTPADDRPPTTTLTSPISGTFSLLPQLLLSGSLPPGTLPSSSIAQDTSKDGSGPKLMTARDALSLPTTSTNFKRFVARAGPIFWLQDRIEEIVMWRRGWKVTGVWMAAYAFLCYFPRLIFMLPHIALIGIILASYPYTSDPTIATTPPESSVNWQANLQAIQNLMGLIADIYDFIHPHTPHLILSPSHFPFHPIPTQSPRPFPSTPALSSSHSRPSSPYPPYILTLLILTFPPLLFVLSSAFFPVRSLCLILGLGPFVYTHPLVRPFHPYIGPMLEGAANYIIKMLVYAKRRVRTLKHVYWSRWVLRRGISTSIQPCNEKDGEFRPVRTILERVMDDDKLSDKLWRSEMREVELWENERFASTGGGPSIEDPHPPTSRSDSQTRSRTDSSTSISSGSSPTASPTRTRHLSLNNPILQPNQTRGNTSGWSKSNLRPAERGPWTRRRDGWGGVGAEISNLTFSLAQGWAFVPNEGWRKDRTAGWAFASDVSSRSDGWVYTNDVWADPSPVPYSGTAGSGGSVTRKRRWVRRIWFEGSAEGGRMVW